MTLRNADNRTTILFIIATLDPAGAERQMLQLATRLDREQFRPVVCCITRGGPLEDKLREAEIPLHVLSKRRKIEPSIVTKLARIIKREDARIVHTWLFTANAYGRAAAIWSKCQPAIIASERCVDDWKSGINRKIDRWLAKRTDYVVANADAVRDFCVSAEKLPDNKVITIRNGVEPLVFDEPEARRFREQHGLDTHDILIGSAGRLARQKGIDTLLDAFALVWERQPRAKLLIAGHGEDKDALKAQARRLEIDDRVTFLGELESMEGFLCALDIFALASRWEGSPNVLLEAMMYQRPVVTTNVGASHEIITDGESGFIVPPENKKAMAARILWLLEHHDAARKMAHAGRIAVEERFSMERMVIAYQDLYQRVIAEKQE